MAPEDAFEGVAGYAAQKAAVRESLLLGLRHGDALAALLAQTRRAPPRTAPAPKAVLLQGRPARSALLWAACAARCTLHMLGVRHRRNVAAKSSEDLHRPLATACPDECRYC